MDEKCLSSYQLYDHSYSKAIYSRSTEDGKDGAFRRGVAALPALGEPPLAGRSRAAMGTYYPRSCCAWSSEEERCLVWCSALVVLQRRA
jgi:hypothetical protein